MRGARDREPSEAPLWARAEAEAARFSPRRIAPERRSPWSLVLGAAVAITGLIGLAGASPAQPTQASGQQRFAAASLATPAATLEAIDVRPPALGSIQAASGRPPVTLRTPTGRDGPITTAAVPVDGLVSVRASSIQVALELDKFHRIDAVDIDTNPEGMLRPDTTPAFHVDLALPTPRPIGQAWVVITAYDRSGNSLGTVRWAVLIGNLTSG
ncbi:MAG TPA: hypothetical protein VE011_07585 [Candidatus Dormibacteraeota bacterium]|nr:hypothetical protein [Candidatus Dormibacteraeota bacterium]